MSTRESTSARFIRVAGKRTKRILKQLELLGNCSNTHNYRFTEEQIAKIFDTIEKQALEARNKFSVKRSDDFRL